MRLQEQQQMSMTLIKPYIFFAKMMKSATEILDTKEIVKYGIAFAGKNVEIVRG